MVTGTHYTSHGTSGKPNYISQFLLVQLLSRIRCTKMMMSPTLAVENTPWLPLSSLIVCFRTDPSRSHDPRAEKQSHPIAQASCMMHVLGAMTLLGTPQVQYRPFHQQHRMPQYLYKEKRRPAKPLVSLEKPGRKTMRSPR